MNSLIKFAIQFLEWCLEKIPVYLREQYLHKKANPKFNLFYTKENWETYKQITLSEIQNNLFAKRKEHLLTLDPKELKRNGITISDDRIDIDPNKCSVNLLDQLNKIV